MYNNENTESYNYNYNNNNMNNVNKPPINKSYLVLGLLACIIGIGALCFYFVKSVEKDHEEKNKENNEEESFKREDYDEITLKKKELYEVIEKYILTASAGVNNDLYGDLSDSNVLYYIPVSNIESNTCVQIKNGENPFGEWGEAYVVVNYSPYQYTYDYYFTFYDNAGYSLPLTNYKKLSETGDEIVRGGEINKDTITAQTIDTISKTYILKKSSDEILPCFVR